MTTGLNKATVLGIITELLRMFYEILVKMELLLVIDSKLIIYYFSSDGKAKWCYISQKQNVCKDASPSSRWTYGGRPRKWSYIACSTPDRNSPICEEHFKGNNMLQFII